MQSASSCNGVWHCIYFCQPHQAVLFRVDAEVIVIQHTMCAPSVAFVFNAKGSNALVTPSPHRCNIGAVRERGWHIFLTIIFAKVFYFVLLFLISSLNRAPFCLKHFFERIKLKLHTFSIISGHSLYENLPVFPYFLQ